MLTAGRHGASIRCETDAGFPSETQLSVDAGQHELQIATLRGVSKLLLSERTAKHEQGRRLLADGAEKRSSIVTSVHCPVSRTTSTHLITCVVASVPKPDVVD